MLSHSLSNQPLVTVIIPTVNRSSLARAVESVLAQTHRRIELIVVGDGCRPNLDADSLSELEFCQLIEFPRSGRPAPLRNEGIRLASGELIAFLDDDDFWHTEKLQLQIEMLRLTPAVAACSNATTARCEDRQRYFSRAPSLSYAKACLSNPVILSSLVIRSSVVASVAGFPENERFRGFEDHVLALQLLSIGDIKFIDRPLVLYDESGGDRLSIDLADRVLESYALSNWEMARFLMSRRPGWWWPRAGYNAALVGVLKAISMAPHRVQHVLLTGYRRIRDRT